MSMGKPASSNPKSKIENPKSVYDVPHLYDIAFSDETLLECDFFEAAFAKYCPFAVRRVLEPACGSGRLVVEMARRGYEVTGFDLSEPSLKYLAAKLKRRGVAAHLFRADMADFKIATPVDAAFNTWNSFRHLLTESSARRHLECMGRAVRSGGIYILGLHLIPPDADLDCTERWKSRRGSTTVSVTLRVLEASRRKRLEHLRFSLLARSPRGEMRVRHDFTFRLYTAAQFRKLLASTPQWKLVDVYDFWYEIDEPLKLNNDISDTVFVLRRA